MEDLELSSFEMSTDGPFDVLKLTRIKQFRVVCKNYNLPILVNSGSLETLERMCEGISNIFMETPTITRFYSKCKRYEDIVLFKRALACPKLENMEIFAHDDERHLCVRFAKLAHLSTRSKL